MQNEKPLKQKCEIGEREISIFQSCISITHRMGGIQSYAELVLKLEGQPNKICPITCISGSPRVPVPPIS